MNKHQQKGLGTSTTTYLSPSRTSREKHNMPWYSRKQNSLRNISPCLHLPRCSFKALLVNGRNRWVPWCSHRRPMARHVEQDGEDRWQHRLQTLLTETSSPREDSPSGPERYRMVPPSLEIIWIESVTPEVIWVKDIPTPSRTPTRPTRPMTPRKVPPSFGEDYLVNQYTTSTRTV